MPPRVPDGFFKVLYFASAASFTRKSVDHLAGPLPASELFNTLENKYPGMIRKILVSCAVTVDLEYIEMEGLESTPNLMIQPGSEVAIIPPVSSG